MRIDKEMANESGQMNGCGEEYVIMDDDDDDWLGHR
jgi:hypothetical protein